MRTFSDPRGRQWTVWEVHPTMAERRAARQAPSVVIERRTHDEARASLPGELRNGWLVFECRTERRRLAPIPEGWASMSDAELNDLLGRATPAGKPKRLIE